MTDDSLKIKSFSNYNDFWNLKTFLKLFSARVLYFQILFPGNQVLYHAKKTFKKSCIMLDRICVVKLAVSLLGTKVLCCFFY